ncbi:hypothetical protein I7I51_09145 [Histoplasma capsulatum]|uniref:Uncharacterized protein n=1 Tax=Ajellomyces capsulatus TaxID=5037 RepID=A0A8A1M0X2_AJECA|nr:hypothetical protein I7I51_09145 [Histoplasma capsulatum]
MFPQRYQMRRALNQGSVGNGFWNLFGNRAVWVSLKRGGQNDWCFKIPRYFARAITLGSVKFTRIKITDHLNEPGLLVDRTPAAQNKCLRLRACIVFSHSHMALPCQLHVRIKYAVLGFSPPLPWIPFAALILDNQLHGKNIDGLILLVARVVGFGEPVLSRFRSFDIERAGAKFPCEEALKGTSHLSLPHFCMGTVCDSTH